MKKLFLITFLFLLHNSPCFAQQTIVNVPSADVMEKQKSFFQHESQFRTKERGRFWNTTEYFAHGIGHNTELDATLFNLSSPASNNVSLGLGFKSAIPLKIDEIKDYKPQVTVGSMVPFSLQGNGAGHWIYGSGSITIPQSNSRFTAGISDGTKQIFGEAVTCFFGGFEQKISNEVSFVSEWYSGKHAMGIFTSGFNYSLPQDMILFAGYQIPNSKEKAGRQAFVASLAKTF